MACRRHSSHQHLSVLEVSHPTYMACHSCQKGVEVWAEICPYCGADIHGASGDPFEYPTETPPAEEKLWWRPYFERAGLLWGWVLAALWVAVIVVNI